MTLLYTLRSTLFVLALVGMSTAFLACSYEFEERSPGQDSPTVTARCPGGSMEQCFSYDEMGEFVDTVTPLVAQFFEQEYPDMPPPRVVFIPSGEAVRSPCLDATGERGFSDSNAYEYCGANATIYVGQDLVWQFFKLGDAAPVIGLAHEWGHHVQVQMGVPPPQSLQQSVTFENQADCISGAWAQYADEQGWLEKPDDLEDVGILLQAIGTREGAGRDHGTEAERRASFQSGFVGGLQACNRYFPRTPII